MDYPQVYDVTPFMDDHPGGDEVLLSATGKDATNDFEDIGHSDEAREMMDKYYIGEIDPATVPSKRTFSQPPQQAAAHSANKSPDFVIKILQFLVPLLILGLAFAVRDTDGIKDFYSEIASIKDPYELPRSFATSQKQAPKFAAFQETTNGEILPR
ncbi:cytochrome b5-like [Salvia splendens]|uniref:cytochrome b5-like n=1 Tax=Salvia splendens TaxID=180675 RepID=UPI001C27E399|nr:cytochrome b5-like [Salvia splendens]